MSSLLELDSSLAPSDSVSTSTALHTKKKAPVWKHSCALRENEDQTLLYCIHCKLDSDPLPYSIGLAGNLMKHIKRWHPLIIIEKA